MGVRLVFIKKPKKVMPGIVYQGITPVVKHTIPGITMINPDEQYHDDDYINKALEAMKKNKSGIIFDGITFE